EPGETCDDGDADDTNGCTTKCAFSCVTPAIDCGAAAACQKFSCNAAHVCTSGADSSQNGSACGAGKACNAGSCDLLCGNSKLDPGEACDDGNKTDGDGCQHDCTFTCSNPVNDCPAAGVCDTYTCSAAHLCQQGSKAQYTQCGSGLVCDASGNCLTACG